MKGYRGAGGWDYDVSSQAPRYALCAGVCRSQSLLCTSQSESSIICPLQPGPSRVDLVIACRKSLSSNYSSNTFWQFGAQKMNGYSRKNVCGSAPAAAPIRVILSPLKLNLNLEAFLAQIKMAKKYMV